MKHTIVPGEQVPFDPVIADLFWETGKLVFNELFKGDIALWREMCGELWPANAGLFARSHAYVAVDKFGAIVGLVDYVPGTALGSDFVQTVADMERLVSSDFFVHLSKAVAALEWLFPPIPPDAVAILHLAVDKAYRGKGIGIDLLNSAEDAARRSGLRSAHLDVDVQKPAVEFYRQRGYQEIVETRYLAWPDVHPHFRMIKTLQQETAATT